MQRNLDRSRGGETGVEHNRHRQMQLSRICRGTNQQKAKEKLDRSTRCQEAIKETGAFSIDPPGVEKLSRLR